MIIGVSGRIGSGKDLVGKIIQYLIYMDKEVKDRYYPYDVFIEELDIVNLTDVSGWEIRKFADKLKEIVCLLLNCTREQLEDREFKEAPLGSEWDKWAVEDNDPECYSVKYYSTLEEAKFSLTIDGENHSAYKPKIKKVVMTPRLLLQLLGTECGRQIIHPNCWINATMADYIPDEGYSYKVERVSDTQLRVLTDPEKYNNGYPDWIITDVRFPNEAEAIKDKGGIIIRVNRDSILNNDTHESETALDDYKDFNYIIHNDSSIENLIFKVKEILIKENIING